MHLIKRAILYFKEGNSDKVYEIQLCDVGNDKYVVNFSYGRRGTPLKEGTKTPVPVSLTEAERIYDVLETEKLGKGYTASENAQPPIKVTKVFTLSEPDIAISTNWAGMQKGREKAILQRLHYAVDGSGAPGLKPWKLSRVIWKAGEYKIKDAIPYLVRLYSTGNAMQKYCCTWALARCRQSETSHVLESINKESGSPLLSRIAGAGLLMLADEQKRNQQLEKYFNTLPEDFKILIANQQSEALNILLLTRIVQKQTSYNWIENIYLLSTENRWLKPLVKNLLRELPLRPGYFKQVRILFKLSELMDDFETLGMLSCRIEREEEMFKHYLNREQAVKLKTYIDETEDSINLVKELGKPDSRIAYSNKTRYYFRRRTGRRLQMLGDWGNLDYVKMATGILIGYDSEIDFREHYSEFNYEHNGRNYERVETRYLQNAHAVYMHQILSGSHPGIQLDAGRRWFIKNDQHKKASSKTEGQNTVGGLLKKITSFFSRKRTIAVTATPKPPQVPDESNKNGTPYLNLWNQLPQAYMQLLMEGKMEEIHQFAIENLTAHPDFAAIKNKLDKQTCKQLLLSVFNIPAEFGYMLAEEKYANSTPEQDLVLAMLNSNITCAQNRGREWAEANISFYVQDAGFVLNLMFAKHEKIRKWGEQLLLKSDVDSHLKKAVTGKLIAFLLNLTAATAPEDQIIKDASDTAGKLLIESLNGVNVTVISELLRHPVNGVLLFGLRLLKLNKQHINFNELSEEFIRGLLSHSYLQVRETGLELLHSTTDETLQKKSTVIVEACLSVYADVRQGIAPLIGRMSSANREFGDKAADVLLPYLLRKETSEGLHADVSNLLCNQLSDHLQNANKTTALNLLYSNYYAAQNVGVIILEKYTDASQLTMPQVIALGNHENLNVREWCWKFYAQQTARIIYEKDSSIKLLESKWADTRGFAIKYFSEQFTQNDWAPETLITLADSVKPDVEAFGRALITKYFTDENGVQYLLKLSQHPGEKMQLFATNYLERFAADDKEKLQSLEFYFRSILTRVNKSRIAKDRIFKFLLAEGRKSEEAAVIVSNILSDISATAAIGDKAKCIEVLLQLKALYEVSTPLKVLETETRY